MSFPDSPSVPAPEDCEYSIATWKHVPTTAEVLFGLRLPYQPPKSAVGAYLWRKRLWVETTFALTMLQPWEKLILVIFMNTFLVLIAFGLYFYFPNHLSFLASRAKYYLLGLDDPDVGVAESFARMVSSWSWNDTTAQVAKIVDL